MSDLMKEVSKEEFDAFLAAYPRPLTPSASMMFDPPFISFNDFERAPLWPDSIVASSVGGKGGFKVLKDINSAVPDDGARDTDTPIHDNNGVELKEGDRVLVKWGGTYFDGTFTPDVREETIVIRERGSKYEHWSFESCHNIVRRMDMVKVK